MDSMLVLHLLPVYIMLAHQWLLLPTKEIKTVLFTSIIMQPANHFEGGEGNFFVHDIRYLFL